MIPNATNRKNFGNKLFPFLSTVFTDKLHDEPLLYTSNHYSTGYACHDLLR
jgi:hypothetical protein